MLAQIVIHIFFYLQIEFYVLYYKWGGMKMKNNTGFTLVELIIALVIVSILSLTSVPIYQRYIERSRETELDAVIPAIINAQRLHYLEYEELADDMSKLAVQLEGTPTNYDGRNGIKTENYFYAVGNNANDSGLYATSWIYVYRNKKGKYNSTGPKFGLELFYIKSKEWYFTKNNVRKTVKRGNILSWVMMTSSASSGSKEIDDEFKKAYQKFDHQIW